VSRNLIGHIMRLLAFAVVLLAISASVADTTTYLSPDKALTAAVTSIAGGNAEKRESRVKIRAANGKPRFVKSFASMDGEHGYTVVRAGWIPDSNFCVFSVLSSGGHQPWNSPAYFYDRADRKLRLLFYYVGPITEPNFELSSRNVPRTSKLKRFGDLEAVAVEIQLSTVARKPKQ